MSIERDERPWGFYEVVDEGDGFRVKRICIHPQQRLSYQRHSARSEHWYVVAGRGRITLDGVERAVGPGDTAEVPAGMAHRAATIGKADLVIIEVQTGAYFGEDDIVRLADDYGRFEAPVLAD